MAGDTAELGTRENPYIFSDIPDTSFSYWTHFINMNPGECWIKVELEEGYYWGIGVSLEAEDGSYVNSMVEIYDYNFYLNSSAGYPPPDSILTVDGLQVGAGLEYFAGYTRRLLY